MRIISGKYRGRRIDPPAGFSARPTTDYARESLFNILSNRISFDEVDVLDLFSGTGSISYEFASRGASSVHLVEKDHRSILFIRRKLEEMSMSNVRAIQADTRAFLRTCTMKFDIVFADPPYNLAWLPEIPVLVLKSDILKEGGFLVIEHPKAVSFTGTTGFFEHRYYGSVNFSFFK